MSGVKRNKSVVLALSYTHFGKLDEGSEETTESVFKLYSICTAVNSSDQPVDALLAFVAVCVRL